MILSGTHKYNLHIIGLHVIEDVVFAIITPSVDLCTVHDNLFQRRIAGKGAFFDFGDWGRDRKFVKSAVFERLYSYRGHAAEVYLLQILTVLEDVVGHFLACLRKSGFRKIERFQTAFFLSTSRHPLQRNDVCIVKIAFHAELRDIHGFASKKCGKTAYSTDFRSDGFWVVTNVIGYL